MQYLLILFLLCLLPHTIISRGWNKQISVTSKYSTTLPCVRSLGVSWTQSSRLYNHNGDEDIATSVPYLSALLEANTRIQHRFFLPGHGGRPPQNFALSIEMLDMHAHDLPGHF